MTSLAGISGTTALFTDGTPDGVTVIVDIERMTAFAPQPYVAVDPTRWDEPDPARVPTSAYAVAEEALAAAGAPAPCTKRASRTKYAVPKSVRNAVVTALTSYTRTDSDESLMQLAEALSGDAPIDYRTACHVSAVLAFHNAPSLVASASSGKTSFSPPKGVQRAAQRALELIKDGRAGAGFTDTGRARAAQLARGDAVSRDTLKRMNAFFTRHAGDKKPGWSATGKETPGYVAHMAWGGDAGAAWARKMVTSFKAEEGMSAAAVPPGSVASLLGGEITKKWTDGIIERSRTASLLSAVDSTDESETQSAPEVSEQVQEHDQGQDQDQEVIDPTAPHEFSPFLDDDSQCAVCLAGSSSLVHIAAEETSAEPLVAAGDLKYLLVNADKFFAVDPNFEGEPEFFVTLAFNAQDVPSSVTAIFAYTDKEKWFTWSPKTGNWSDTAEPADVVPIDAQGAYSAAVFMSDGGADSAPITEIDELEWELVRTALKAIPMAPHDTDATNMNTFCITYDDADEDALEHLRIDGLYLKTRDAECYEWDPWAVDWIPVPPKLCPTQCVDVDSATARDVAARMVAGAQDGTYTPSRGKFSGRPGWDKEASIGKGVNRPSKNAIARPTSRHVVSGYEFDTSFSRAMWISGTGNGQSVNPGSTATSFSTVSITADGGYTPEERSKNASKQFRDANGRFASSGDVMHVSHGTGKGSTVKVISYDPNRDMVLVEYGDGRQQHISPKDLLRLGKGNPAVPTSGTTEEEKPKFGDQQAPFDASKIRAKPRSTRLTPKAWLDTTLQPMNAEALKKVVSDYQGFIDAERKRRLKKFASLTPETSDIRPLYLAEVDELDNQAVIELISLVPANEKTSELTAFVRRNGKWEADEKYLMRIKSTNPPPLVVITEEIMATVKKEVDAYYASVKESEDAVTAALIAQVSSHEKMLWTDDGVLIPADLITDESLTAAGVPGVADTPSDIAAARRLKRYWTKGAGAAKIRWNTGGDWYRCTKHLTKYMGIRAKGYCFSGDTEFTTRDGVMTFEEAVGTKQFVMTTSMSAGDAADTSTRRDGYWVEAPIEYFGEQRLLTITLTRDRVTKIIRATPEHRWLGTTGRGKDTYIRQYTTDTLRPGVSLPALSVDSTVSELIPSNPGICAGIVFGDGSYGRKNTYGGRVDLHGEKTELLEYFSGYRVLPQKPLESGLEVIRVAGLPIAWNSLPSLSESDEYLYSWLAGYLAADGNVSKDGSIVVSTYVHENAEFVQTVAVRLGIGCSLTSAEVSTNYRESVHTVYRITLRGATVPPQMILRSAHKKNYDVNKFGYERARWKVVSVEDHGESGPVYCAVVPETEKFVLTDNLVTMNCTNLHKEVTGMYTGDRLHRQMYGRKKGLRADGSAYLISLPTEVLAARGEADQLTTLPALAEIEIPDTDDLRNLSYRPQRHSLKVGERFLVNGGDGVYVLSVLDPASTFGWTGDPAILVGKGDGTTALLREVNI